MSIDLRQNCSLNPRIEQRRAWRSTRSKYVRQEVPDKDLNPERATNELFKVAYEIGKPSAAESVRSSQRQTKVTGSFVFRP